MSNADKTPLSNKCDILAELWLNYKNDTAFEDFIQYNDLGLPLAYAVSQGIIEINEQATLFVEDTWHLLMYSLADDSEDNITWTDDNGNDEEEAWRLQEFSTLDELLEYFSK